MNKRRTITGLVIVGLALAAFGLFKLLGPRVADEAEAASDVAVHVGRVVRATLHRYVSAYGTVEPEPPGSGRPGSGAIIAPAVGGLLTEVLCAEGGTVAAGAVLFRLDRRVSEVSVSRAAKQLEFAQATFERQKQLLAGDGTSRRSYQEAEQQLESARAELAAARMELALHEVATPVAGTVVRLSGRVGQSVDPNTTLAEVIALDRLVVSARVPSREAALLKAGQPTDFGPASPAAGTVTVVGKSVDPANDTVLVRISVPREAGLLPGRFLSLRITCEERRDCLAVPEASVVAGPGGGGVLMVVEGDRAVPKPVQAGLREGGLVEVESDGLKEGMIVVTEDAYNLVGETKVHIVGEK